MKIEFTINENPPTRTAQQKGVRVVGGKPIYYTKESVRSAKEWYAWHLKPYVPDVPFVGAVKVVVAFCFESKGAKTHWYKTTRPDLDNLEKALFDVMTDLGFWKDDSQIVLKESLKMRCPVGEGHLAVIVEDLE